MAAFLSLPPSRISASSLGFRSSDAVRSQCAPRRRYKRASRLPLHTPDHWGLAVQEPEIESSEEGCREQVMDFLRGEGISGGDIDQLDLPLSVDVVRERLEFLASIGLEKAHILRYPVVLTCSVKRNMVPVIDYLDKLGFTPEELPALLTQFPMILYSSIAIDLTPIVDYLLGYGISLENIPKVLLRYPDVLGFKREGTMSTSVAYLVSIGVNTRQIGPMLTRFPELLGMRVGNNIKRKVDFYRGLGFTKEEIARLLEKHPYVLGFDLEENVKAKVECLLQAGIQEKELPSFIARFPDVFELDLRAKLAEKTAWLTNEIFLRPSDVPRVFERLPQMLVINEKMAGEKVKFLQGTGISAGDIAKMVVDCPQILAVKLEETLKPNLAFFQQKMRKPLSELLAFPVYLTYDLARRIKPRYRMVERKKINCSLAWFLACSDDKFKRRMSVQFMEAPPQAHTGSAVFDEEDDDDDSEMVEDTGDIGDGDGNDSSGSEGGEQTVQASVQRKDSISQQASSR
ncbi:hypothetical protein SELMODRAFT_121675 [Selaginella moellendorffii]|uniref:Uncharacterized protein n=1 Tax=Selaginella moellendorffii TaxID=88036 RepID=D8SP45_SELML|nr:transcription termination factor MTERF4, chloroplastic [Selaginella moellendorffii]EFJ13716.1 hypothetical protein SELMODRAFT_121675 [Selaginella moellendorffii]|eukprot:XP_002985222.1 transcription termination factor MTERF4, chloroplastic [Selaginella moellendorffii]